MAHDWATDAQGAKLISSNHSTSEVSPQRHTRYKRYTILSRSEWLYELLALVTSMVIFGLIVAIFWCMKNRALSDWPFSFSISSAISILSALWAATTMQGVSEFISQIKWLYFKRKPHKLSTFKRFDEASRGFWGSTYFLATVKWDQLATLGALLMVVRLGFGPLVQQGIQIEQRFALRQDESVTFGYAQQYKRNLNRLLANGAITSIPPEPGLESAIVQGLYGIDSTAVFNCPGLCDWNQTYISIGFKSECKNVTTATLQSKACQRTSGSTREDCNMTTPAGLNLSTEHFFTEHATSYVLTANSTMEVMQPFLPRLWPKFIQFAIYRSTPDHNFVPQDINITECSLSLTVLEYTNARANGSEFSFESVKEVEFSSQNPWDLDRDSGQITGKFQEEGNDVDGTRLVSIGQPELQTIVNFFESGTVSSERFEGSKPNSNLGLSSALYGDVDIAERFERLATAMTDFIRRGPNQKLAKGRRIEVEQFVSVRWYYLIGPLAMQLGSLVLAVCTIIASRKSSDVPLWKSSALALLECRYEQEGLRAEVKDIKAIERTADGLKARLE